MFAEKAGAQIPSLAADDVHQPSVGAVPLPADQLTLVDPGMAGGDPVGPLGGNDAFGIAAFDLHDSLQDFFAILP